MAKQGLYAVAVLGGARGDIAFPNAHAYSPTVIGGAIAPPIVPPKTKMLHTQKG